MREGWTYRNRRRECQWHHSKAKGYGETHSAVVDFNFSTFRFEFRESISYKVGRAFLEEGESSLCIISNAGRMDSPRLN